MNLIFILTLRRKQVAIVIRGQGVVGVRGAGEMFGERSLLIRACYPASGESTLAYVRWFVRSCVRVSERVVQASVRPCVNGCMRVCVWAGAVWVWIPSPFSAWLWCRVGVDTFSFQ